MDVSAASVFGVHTVSYTVSTTDQAYAYSETQTFTIEIKTDCKNEAISGLDVANNGIWLTGASNPTASLTNSGVL